MSDEDKKFYDIWAEEDRPVDDQRLALDAARLKSKKYNLDNRIYIVRGYDIFVVHSNDVGMEKGADGLRTITIRSSRMVKYAEDGSRQTD